ncbi:hypothetical protein JRI60_00360 [Archangium violaceum]|uniref:hypothetical protein n=1 Tax=Archangium violaceum TaxID=83451 RepID=UPI00194F1416|nr:hypothetical protein [Archangium violaceum]QRN97583.1 hypothetical protein JRI60_00360 [Archangium violaceum]
MVRSSLAKLLFPLMLGIPAVSAAAPVLYDDSHPWWDYSSGTWTADTGVSGAIYGTQHLTSVAGSGASIWCQPTPYQTANFTYYFTSAYNRGKARIQVMEDSWGLVIYETVVDLYATGVNRQQAYTVNIPYVGNSYGIYISATGTKSDASINTFVDIDAVQCN